MLYKFKSKATGDLILLEPHGRHILGLIGKDPSPKGILLVADMPAAMPVTAVGKIFKPTLQAAFVINRRVGHTVIGREVRQALSEQPLPALAAEVRQRIVFADSVASGTLASELEPEGRAAEEIRLLAAELRAVEWCGRSS